MRTAPQDLLALAIVALAQTGVLAMMVIDRVLLLDRAARSRCRSFPSTRAISSAASTCGSATTSAACRRSCSRGRRRGRNAAVLRDAGAARDGAWPPVKVTRALPKETSPDRIVLKARSALRWQARRRPTPPPVRYGIESYFVPEGQGKRLEDLAREKKMAALIAVDGAATPPSRG